MPRIAYISKRFGKSAQTVIRIADRQGKTPIIFHLGDHDPSGKDMTRDIFDRMELFMGGLEVKRLALNMDQIEQYDPPPNPAKITDSRATAYIAEFGSSSWELDALEPSVIADLIRSAVRVVRDEKKWKAAVEQERRERAVCADSWDDVEDFLGGRS